jgi:hypothetical protein
MCRFCGSSGMNSSQINVARQASIQTHAHLALTSSRSSSRCRSARSLRPCCWLAIPRHATSIACGRSALPNSSNGDGGDSGTGGGSDLSQLIADVLNEDRRERAAEAGAAAARARGESSSTRLSPLAGLSSRTVDGQPQPTAAVSSSATLGGLLGTLGQLAAPVAGVSATVTRGWEARDAWLEVR